MNVVPPAGMWLSSRRCRFLADYEPIAARRTQFPIGRLGRWEVAPPCVSRSDDANLFRFSNFPSTDKPPWTACTGSSISRVWKIRNDDSTEMANMEGYTTLLLIFRSRCGSVRWHVSELALRGPNDRPPVRSQPRADSMLRMQDVCRFLTTT
ncbi:hypothetical protein N656DRAFT_59157 [Canariomyces notabilis]|uniref:Uncharacterized protein n=1 Tax=Canariomyces notabilis TaxID=2074819 RepID=A0AAN6TPF9_9PEZI|nr:hypothetical protein N656DRAFT_59157 [Canariomyces arenarius]